MSEWKEFTAKTESDALTEASVSFQVPSAMIEYVVLEEQKSGVFGLFSKPAKIKARIRVVEEEAAAVKKEEKHFENSGMKRQYNKKQDTKKADIKQAEIKRQEINKLESKNHEYKKPEVKKPEPKKQEELKSVSGIREMVTKEPVDVEKVEKAAKKFLEEVFAAMKLEVKISVLIDQKENIANINIEGEDMGVLIGKRGQTLDSLQYLTSLVINKETSSYLKVKLDTENYRERRRETLENLAKNIAQKVRRTKHPVSLEPMNPYERRIIHSALQADKFVDTHSEGEEPYRRVVVTLKKGYRDYNRNAHGRYNNKRDYRKNLSERETSEVKTEE